MQDREEGQRDTRTSEVEPALTTEDLTRRAAPGDRDGGSGSSESSGRGSAVYPGEATGERNGTTQAPVDDRLSADAEPAPGRGGGSGRRRGEEAEEPLLRAEDAERYRVRWGEIQGRFVDDPQEAVRSADSLVAEVMEAFAGTLSEHRSGLEKQWDRGEQVATEDLRQALRAYRSLVNRLLDT